MKAFLIKLSVALFLFGAIAVAALATFVYRQLEMPLSPSRAVVITIQPGTTLRQVAERLDQEGVVRDALLLRLLARLNPQDAQIQAGTYKFTGPATPREVLERLSRGDIEKISLTIPEGFTQKQILDRLAKLGHGDRNRLEQLAHNPDFIHSLGVDASSLEGYLFPDTYLFAEGIGEEALLAMMVDLCRSHLTDELVSAAAAQGLSVHHLLTFASIIQKETGVVAEMPIISSVFHNRLERGIPLQTDPTVIYGIVDFDGNLTRKHLRTPTPYNTYLIKGLPPGPIASPGLEALQAAVHPADTDYLFFVARGDGSHQFSKTLREHNAAVRRFQLRR